MLPTTVFEGASIGSGPLVAGVSAVAPKTPLSVAPFAVGPTSAVTALAALQSECQRHLAIRVRAKSFLQNQVRYLVATLLQAGQGQITADGVAQLLAARDNRRAPTLAPAHGLYLARVEYPEASFVATTAPPPPEADEDDSDDEGPPAKRQAVT